MRQTETKTEMAGRGGRGEREEVGEREGRGVRQKNGG